MSRTIITFRASTMDEAMDLVRQELGSDAIVVESKEIACRRLLPWPSTRSEIQISAQSRNRRRDAEQDTGLSDNRSVSPRMVRTLAEALSIPSVTRELLSAIPQLPAGSADEARANVDSLSTSPRHSESFKSTTVSPVPTGQPGEHHAQNDMKSLESLQGIIARFEQQSHPRGMLDVPGELFQQYQQLIEAGVEDGLARDLMVTLRGHLSLDAARSPSAVTATLTALLEREMRCVPPIQPQQGRREIVTLIGPTGVGKTTTLAKLAGHFRLQEGRRVGLITIDTYRVGAIEQLQTYADILRIPLRSASGPDELRIAIDGFDDVDLILIDTAGRSPFDSSKLSQLRDIIQAAGSDHILLVLSLAAGPKMICKIVDQFSFAVPTSLILTKLDEMNGHGELLTVAHQIPYPISYLTRGQDVPDHFESAHPNRLARLILGLDQIL